MLWTLTDTIPGRGFQGHEGTPLETNWNQGQVVGKGQVRDRCEEFLLQA